jgi:threonine dehydrogenase-like Zn-dependent dehydrogenase
MRAVVWEGKPYEMAVRDVPLPKLELPEDAIVRITTTAICGSDLHTYHGLLGSTTPPWQMGHEAVGVVVEVGPATEHFKVGDRVLIPGGPDSGHFAIQHGLAEQPLIYGEGMELGGLTGGTQAEYLRVPFADDSLVALPNDFSSDLDWLFLSDIFITGWVGLDFARFQAGDSVVVFGAGGVGLLCAYIAILRGASMVFVVDHVRERLDKAASIGAVPIDFTSDAGTASEQILRRKPDGVERSVDCIGQTCLNHQLKPQQNYVIEEAIRVTKYAGGIGLPGVYAAQPRSAGTPRGDLMDNELSVSVPQLWIKNLSIGAGSIFPSLYEILPKAFALVKSGKVRLDWLVTSQIGIEDAPEAYRRFDEKLEIKVVIRFPWEREQVRASSEAVQSVAGVEAIGEGPEEKGIASGEKLSSKLPV